MADHAALLAMFITSARSAQEHAAVNEIKELRIALLKANKEISTLKGQLTKAKKRAKADADK